MILYNPDRKLDTVLAKLRAELCKDLQRLSDAILKLENLQQTIDANAQLLMPTGMTVDEHGQSPSRNRKPLNNKGEPDIKSE